MRNRILFSALTAILVLISFGVAETNAQSGRRRTRYPKAEEAPPPAPSIKVPLATTVVKKEQRGTVSRFVLKNGITVVVNEVHAYPIAACVAYIKSPFAEADELASARVLQKLMLKGGTPANPPGAVAKVIQDLGGRLYMGSTPGGSFFVARVPSAEIKRTIGFQADLIQHPALSPSELAASVDAVQAEEASLCQDPAAYASNRAYTMAALNGVTFTAYDQISIERLRELYTKNYKPENLVISVTGDVSTFDVLVQVEQLYSEFGAAPAGKAVNAPTTNIEKPAQPDRPVALPSGEQPTSAANEKPKGAEPSAGASAGQAESGTSKPSKSGLSLRYSEERGSLHQTVVTMSYFGPGIGSPDWAAVQVLSQLVGGGPGSMLDDRLVVEQAAARRVSARYELMPDSGVLELQIWLSPETIDKAEAEFFKIVDRLMVDEPSGADLTAARNISEKALYDAAASYDKRALFFALAEAGGRPPMMAADYAELIQGVSAADIRRVARRYLVLQNTSVFEYEPDAAPKRTFDSDAFARTVEAWAPEIQQEASPASRREKQNAVQLMSEGEAMALADSQSIQPLPVKDFSTLNGPRAYVREDHSLPVVTICLLFQGGRLIEDSSNSGITELMLRTMIGGTKRLNSAQLSARLAELGAHVDVVNQPDFFGLSVTALSSNASKALRVMHDVIEEPALADSEVELGRRRQMGAIFESRDAESSRARELLYGVMFPGHPYSLAPHGSEETVSKLKPEQVRDWYQKTIQRQYPLVVVVGDTQGSELISEDIAGGFSRRDLEKSMKAMVPKQAMTGQKVEQTSCRQTLVCIGFPGPKAESDDVAVMDVIGSAIQGLQDGNAAGQPGNLHLALRLAPMMTAGAVYFKLSVKAADLPAIKPELVSLFRELAEKGLTQEELKAARLKAIAARAAGLYYQKNMAFEYARAVFSGQKASSVDSYAEALSKVTAADIKRVAANYLKLDQASTIVLLEAQKKTATQAATQ